jgi:hypothetical protein
MEPTVSYLRAKPLRCLVGFHAWSTWGIPTYVDVWWLGGAAIVNNVGAPPNGVVAYRMAQDHTCVECGKKQRRFFYYDVLPKEELFLGLNTLDFDEAVHSGIALDPTPPTGVDRLHLPEVSMRHYAPLWELQPVVRRSPSICRLGGVLHHRAMSRLIGASRPAACPLCKLAF